jgi:hypothetical protein
VAGERPNFKIQMRFTLPFQDVTVDEENLSGM